MAHFNLYSTLRSLELLVVPGVGLSPGMVDQYMEYNHILPVTGLTCNPPTDLSISAVTATPTNANRQITVSVTVEVCT